MTSRRKDETAPALLEAMMEPDFYPDRPRRVEVKRTHVSHVFLAGGFVYKIKKPVRFPFLDYSTLEKRRHFSEEEVRLNRRLAPGVYLAVEPIYQSDGRFHFFPPGTVAEYAVKMRRLKADRMLDLLVDRGDATVPMIHALAEHLARFHFAPENASVPEGLGSPEQVSELLSRNCDDIRSLCVESAEPWEIEGMENFLRLYLKCRRDLFQRRVRESRIRDGHGDLRCEHISMNSEIMIFDCIEFDASFRSSDVASEIAFLAMDLDHHKAFGLAEELVGHYAEATGDPELPALVPFYKSYRASVRGKVESLKSQEADVPEGERERAGLAARSLFRLAYRYTWKAISPCMILFCGLPGTGKTSLASRIAERSGFSLVSSDRVRKELAGLDPREKRRAGVGEGIYGETWTQKTYHSMFEMAHEVLRRGCGIILDATFLKADYRWPFVRLAADLNLPTLFLECRTPGEIIRGRMERREAAPGEISDATWDVYVKMQEAFEPFQNLGRAEHAVVLTDDAMDAVLMRVEGLIKERLLSRRRELLPAAACD